MGYTPKKLQASVTAPSICRNCKHYKKMFSVNPEYDLCTFIVIAVNPISGKKIYPNCQNSNPDGNCKAFEEKKNIIKRFFKKNKKNRQMMVYYISINMKEK